MRNPYLCLAIVVALAVAGIVGLLGSIVLALWGHEVPGSVVAVMSACFGALSSFLVSPPRGSFGLDSQPRPARDDQGQGSQVQGKPPF